MVKYNRTLTVGTVNSSTILTNANTYIGIDTHRYTAPAINTTG